MRHVGRNPPRARSAKFSGAGQSRQTSASVARGFAPKRTRSERHDVVCLLSSALCSPHSSATSASSIAPDIAITKAIRIEMTALPNYHDYLYMTRQWARSPK